VFDQSNGMRFDIYERIHLQEHVAGIEELDEIELVPRIQVVAQGDYAVLRGHLLLSGIYSSAGEMRSNESLEHLIPVEITLPMNRIPRLEDISIDIDNFDVELLSSRSMNITGVLSLRGIEMLPTQAPEAPGRWGDEEFYAVHQADEGFQQFLQYEPVNWTQPAFRQPESSDEPPQSEETFSSEPQMGETFSSEPIRSGDSFSYEQQDDELTFDPTPATAIVPESNEYSITEPAFEEFNYAAFTPAYETYESIREEQEEAAVEQGEEESESESELKEEDNEVERQPIAADLVNEDPVDDEDMSAFAEVPTTSRDTIPDIAPPEEKKEVKIAFAGKNQEIAEEQQPVGIRSLLHNSFKEQQEPAETPKPSKKENTPLVSEKTDSRTSGDELEWKSLFLGALSNENKFRTVRLCIVQKEETLETIADRYNMSPREIMLYNRLSELSVSEGQVIYIPSS